MIRTTKMIKEKQLDELIAWWQRELDRTKTIYTGSVRIHEIKTTLKVLKFIKNGFVPCVECGYKDKELRYQKYRTW